MATPDRAPPPVLDSTRGHGGPTTSEMLDLTALKIPVPDGVPPRFPDSGAAAPDAVFFDLPGGVIRLSALAAPRDEGLWPERARTIAAARADLGEEVTALAGPWGPELSIVAGDEVNRVIGIDGPRWMLLGRASSTVFAATEIAETMRRMIAGTEVHRGTSPLPVGAPLPLRHHGYDGDDEQPGTYATVMRLAVHPDRPGASAQSIADAARPVGADVQAGARDDAAGATGSGVVEPRAAGRPPTRRRPLIVGSGVLVGAAATLLLLHTPSWTSTPTVAPAQPAVAVPPPALLPPTPAPHRPAGPRPPAPRNGAGPNPAPGPHPGAPGARPGPTAPGTPGARANPPAPKARPTPTAPGARAEPANPKSGPRPGPATPKAAPNPHPPPARPDLTTPKAGGTPNLLLPGGSGSPGAPGPSGASGTRRPAPPTADTTGSSHGPATGHAADRAPGHRGRLGAPGQRTPSDTALDGLIQVLPKAVPLSAPAPGGRP